ISIVLNCIGNGFTVALNLGSALWTASAVNIAHASGWQLNTILILIAAFVVIVNIFFRGYFSCYVFFCNIFFSVPFSFLVVLFFFYFVFFVCLFFLVIFFLRYLLVFWWVGSVAFSYNYH